MLFSVNTSVWTLSFEERHLPLLAKLKAWSADEVEVARSDLEGLPIKAIRAELDRLGLSCTLSASPPTAELSLIHPDPEARRVATAHLRRTVGAAADLGARLLVGPLYAKVGWFTGARPTEQQFGWAVDAFRAIGPDLDAAGLGIAIEVMNRFESYFVPTAAAGVLLCEAIDQPRIGLLLDIAHMAVEEKDPIQALRVAGPWLRHVQTSETDRGTPGTGRLIDWPDFFRTLDAIGYDAACAIESFPFQDHAAAAKVWCWRDSAASPDALARDGLAFLRSTHTDAVGRVRKRIPL